MPDDFFSKNWFDLLQSAFIIVSFLLSYFTIRSEARSRKIEHLLQLNQSYREIWGKTYAHPELLRIREADLNLQAHPITEAERRLVKEVVIHLYAIYEAIRNNQIDKREVERDIADFFGLPIPRRVWEEVKVYHDRNFVRYVERVIGQ